MPPILAITNSRDDALSLLASLTPSGSSIQWFSNCLQGLSYLNRHEACLVLCESRLTDGTWRTIMDALLGMANAPLLVAFPSHGDSALAEDAANVEGFQVQQKPFDEREVGNVIRAALVKAEATVNVPVARSI